MLSTYRYVRRKYGKVDMEDKEQKQQQKNPKSVPSCSHLAAVEQNDATTGVSSEELVKCSQCKEEKRALRKYRLKTILGLLLPFSLQSLDVTM
jgi:hypothetical protein